MYRRRSLVFSSGLRSMIGPGPHENRGSVSGRMGDSTPISRRPSQTPGSLHHTQHHTHSLHHTHSVKVRPLPLRAVPSSQFPESVRQPEKASCGVDSSAVDVLADLANDPSAFSATAVRPAKASPAGLRASAALMSAVHVADRACRLLLDATLILVFSPVIAIWWLAERKHRKDRA